MSVGAGSIKRVARTAKSERKGDVAAAVETEGMEAVVDGEEKDAEVTVEEKAEKKTASGKKKAAEKESSGKRTACETAGKGTIGKAAVQTYDKNVSEKSDTYEVYGIGQQLPVYLL